MNTPSAKSKQVSKKRKAPLLLRVVQTAFPVAERWFPALARRFFITVFFTPLNYAVPEKEKAFARKARLFDLGVEGKRIQCYAWGEGPLIYLVHGWAGRATQFHKIVAGLVKSGFRVIGFDGPAHGRSEGRSTSIQEFEATLRALYAHSGEPEGIIAHSFGGGAVLYAAMNGLPVRKLINIASPTIGDEIINTYLTTINGSPETGRYFKDYVLRTTGKPFEAFTALHFIEHLPKPIDLLLIHDTDDREVSLSHALALIERYPQARLYQTSGLGHTRILKDENVIEECIAFFRDRT